MGFNMLLFANSESREFGERVAAACDLKLSGIEETQFDDGEHKARPIAEVRDCDTFVIQSLFSDPKRSVNEKLCHLLFFIATLKDSRAHSVTALVPYLCYTRQDRRAEAQDPVTIRYLAQLFEAVGTDRVVAMDVHDLPAFQNAFRCPTEHLEALPLFVDYFAGLLKGEPVVIISPDIGGTRRAMDFSAAFSRVHDRAVDTAFVEKHRSGGTIVSGSFAGSIKGRSAIIVDDLIGTGGTILRAERACIDHGARRVVAGASHGIFSPEANTVIGDDLLEQVVITNSGPVFRLDPGIRAGKVHVLDAAAVFAGTVNDAARRRGRTRGNDPRQRPAATTRGNDPQT